LLLLQVAGKFYLPFKPQYFSVTLSRFFIHIIFNPSVEKRTNLTHMKKSYLIFLVTAIIAGCNNEPAPTEPTVAAEVEKIDYAYVPANHPPDNWDRGDQKNIAIVLKSLKAFEMGNVDASLEVFADSVEFAADGIDRKLSKDELKAKFSDGWANMSSMKIQMEDYETVVSKDKKSNWVSLWYKQIMTDKAGKVDSVYCMDDIKVENGKITILDEKTRKYPAAKK